MKRSALFKSLPFALALLVPIGGIRLALHPAGIRLVLLPLFVFGLVPLLDAVMGRQKLTLEEQPRARDARTTSGCGCGCPFSSPRSHSPWFESEPVPLNRFRR